jgi:hypothetical protein
MFEIVPSRVLTSIFGRNPKGQLPSGGEPLEFSALTL